MLLYPACGGSWCKRQWDKLCWQLLPVVSKQASVQAVSMSRKLPITQRQQSRNVFICRSSCNDMYINTGIIWVFPIILCTMHCKASKRWFRSPNLRINWQYWFWCWNLFMCTNAAFGPLVWVLLCLPESTILNIFVEGILCIHQYI